jgi:hypothetical protein
MEHQGIVVESTAFHIESICVPQTMCPSKDNIAEKFSFAVFYGDTQITEETDRVEAIQKLHRFTETHELLGDKLLEVLGLKEEDNVQGL